MKHLHSLQVRLIATFVLVAIVALALSSTVYILVNRGEQERRAVDRVASASPAVFAAFVNHATLGDAESIEEVVDRTASEQDVRVLLIDHAGVVVQDSGHELVGESVGPYLTVDQPLHHRAGEYRTIKPAGKDLALIESALPGLFPRRPGVMAPIGTEGSYSIALAVSTETISQAWLNLLPGLLVAAAIALPVAILMAVAIAQYVTRPLRQLTLATEHLAAGEFDVTVPAGRRDEVGQLSRSFASMASRLGEAHHDMRSLVANVSHDLKTPLTSILGFSQALRDGKATGEAETQRLGGTIHDEAQRLSRRLNDLLYLSQLEGGQASIQREPMSLGALARASASRLLGEPRNRQVVVTVATESGPEVDADGPLLERAVDNLIDNAARYTPAGGFIDVRTELSSGRAALIVRNGPVDIDSDEVPLLFQRFYRRDRSRAAHGDGSGLGLPIARELAELHGGTLTGQVDGDSFEVRLEIPGAGS